MSTKTINDTLDKAIFSIYRTFPFWGFIMERCKISLSKKIPTACIDKMGHMYVNPDFIMGLSFNQIVFLIAHEVHHVALSHHERMGYRHPLRWNYATDYVINASLVRIFEECGMVNAAPPNLLYDDRYENMAAELVYDKLPKSENLQKNPMAGDLSEVNDEDAEVIKDYRIPPSEKEEEKEVRDWKSIAVEASTSTKLFGKMSEDIDREVLNNIKPKINWDVVLKRYLQDEYLTHKSLDHTFSKRNRRQGHNPVILPAKDLKPNKKPIIFAIDTSGSINQKTLSQATAELFDIQTRFDIKIYMIQCDTKIQEARWITPRDSKKVKIKGGGGTDFTPIFTHVKEKSMQNSLVVVYTDGYGEFGTKALNKTLWLMTTNVVAPWGTTLRIEET